MPLKLALTMMLTIFLLFGFLFGILAFVGYYFALPGTLVVALAVLLVFIQWLVSPYIIWWTTNMRPLEKNEYPWLWKMVEDLCKKNKVPIPQLAIVYSGSPNAFVFGRTPKSATLAVTQGLLKSLTKDEIRAVIGHEIGHIKHRDMIVMTVAGAIPVIMYFIARFLIFTPSDRERRNAGAAVLVGLIAYLLYFVTNLLVLFLSRLREYYADRFSAENTKPRLLASALAKITYGLSISRDKYENSAVRAFFISDPITASREISALSSVYEDLEVDENELNKAMEWEKKNLFARISEIFSTHPLTWKRIKALMELEKEK